MIDINSAQTLFGIFFGISFALITDRAGRKYRSFDTYSAWRGSPHALRRIVTAWIVLGFLPLLQFAVIIVLLDGVNVTMDATLSDIFVLVALGFLSFFSFGYERLYEAIMHLSPATFFPEEERPSFIKGERRHIAAHFVPGLLYILASFLLLLFIFAFQGR